MTCVRVHDQLQMRARTTSTDMRYMNTDRRARTYIYVRVDVEGMRMVPDRDMYMRMQLAI